MAIPCELCPFPFAMAIARGTRGIGSIELAGATRVGCGCDLCSVGSLGDLLVDYWPRCMESDRITPGKRRPGSGPRWQSIRTKLTTQYSPSST
jgi:hypothetical protein